MPEPGLRAKYFTNPTWSGAPLLTVVDREISTEILASRTGDYFARFSVQWSGYLVVHHPGVYRFTTTSDDGSDLEVDDRLVVWNLGSHGRQEAGGEIVLTRGVHPFYVRYSQEGGPFEMSVAWAPIGEPMQPIPPHLLSPDPVTYAGYWLRVLAPYAAGALAAAALLLVLRRAVPSRARWRQSRAGAFAGRTLALFERPGPAVATIVIVGSAIRAGVLLGSRGILWPDSGIYFYTAQGILGGRIFDHDAFRTAFYPLFLSLFLRFGESQAVGTAVIGAQHALGLVAAVLFYLVGRRVFTPLVAFAGALLFSVHTIELYYENCVLSETLFVFAMSAALLAFAHVASRPARWVPIVAGLLCGLLTLVRPVAQWYAACVVPFVWTARRPMSKAMTVTLAIVVVNFAVLAPWMVANQRQYGFWGVSIGRGLGLFTRVFEIDRLPPPHDTRYAEVKQLYVEGLDYHWGANNLRDDLNYKHGYSYRQVDEMMFGLALDAVLEHPVTFALNSARQWVIQLGGSLQGARVCKSLDGPYLCSGRTEGFSLSLFANAPTPEYRKLRTWLAAYIERGYVRMPVVFGLSLLGLLGYVLDPTRRTPLGGLLALTIAYYTFVPAMLEWPQDRYRLPVDALIFMFAAWGIRTLLHAGDSLAPDAPPAAAA